MKNEIAASDDEDEMMSDSSGESLADLSKLLGGVRKDEKALPRASQPTRYLPHTPKAKRAALNIDSSPLPILSKYKFDLKALAKDAHTDSATQASSARLKTQSDILKESAGASRASTPASAISNTIIEQGAENPQNVLRAMQRADKGQLRPQYCFFAREPEPDTAKIPPEAAQPPWRLFMKDTIKSREQHIVSGLPMTVVQKKRCMPDAVFRWILRDLCTQRSTLIRQEYCHMISCCQNQISEIIQPDQVLELFMALGADESLTIQDTGLPLQHTDEPYKGRNWSCLRSVLELLGLIADQLPVASTIHTIQIILRMALDRFLICNVEVLTQFEDTLNKLTAAIPLSQWNEFCFQTATLLRGLAKEQSLQINSLLCIPTSSKRTHELRRRLAISCLFDNPQLSSKHPEQVLTIQNVIERLNKPDFIVRSDTDFTNLRAGVTILDIAIDDGSVPSFENANEEKQFNALIDELTSKLQAIWGNINDSGMKLARTEAKSVVEWVLQRVQYSIRTRKKMKQSIFDLPGQANDEHLPKQQDFMKAFLKRKTNPAQTDTS